ncbi:hypothetical protein [Methylomonas fluvii]|uniref:Transposase n=1 Tax=Methylomonas fluvii TaxID=1854564 RepID=A0ABR9DJP6_9GAMM|nr:hypothetical protein [Methylomonas fluvii]MBD9363334.1 hypothetical protein [Methylomonas fluvii]
MSINRRFAGVSAEEEWFPDSQAVLAKCLARHRHLGITLVHKSKLKS